MSKENSSIALLKLLANVMPEELLLDKAIEALKEYKEEKFGDSIKVEIPSDNTEEGESLQDFFSKTTEQVEEKEEKVVIQPLAQVMSLVMKWQSMGETVEEIVEDSEIEDSKEE